ncbi:transcriptional regulator, TetR family [Bifidobacterium actinocoloniiforme DSM 22766]|uniref:Transcriptional regulator, TetR family n=1 Tax=Bifidobacterium actinocoloniiforme DSM 22766 TaxID=1437605 RepID=A0A086YYI1_9BIFI|nr:TetR/AcrR family transcriptional regulator [Bifidobacterium actinocoloniiforme]KFI39331.1 transcriptional regulator, TetR family [Bifidobacterium actinocoloniiforme DSM 22766]
MGRHRDFDTDQALKQARQAFLAHGYEGTSIDDLVKATGLLRGSLYSAFGSKRGIFLAVLRKSLKPGKASAEALEVALVAMMELSASDGQIQGLLERYFAALPLPAPAQEAQGPSHERSARIARLLGQALLKRAQLSEDGTASQGKRPAAKQVAQPPRGLPSGQVDEPDQR